MVLIVLGAQDDLSISLMPVSFRNFLNGVAIAEKCPDREKNLLIKD